MIHTGRDPELGPPEDATRGTWLGTCGDLSCVTGSPSRLVSLRFISSWSFWTRFCWHRDGEEAGPSDCWLRELRRLIKYTAVAMMAISSVPNKHGIMMMTRRLSSKEKERHYHKTTLSKMGLRKWLVVLLLISSLLLATYQLRIKRSI